jgi:hypothetical protein
MAAPAEAVALAAGMGLLTAVLPCPLAANVAALGFVSRHVDRRGAAVLTGLLYAAGRMLTYAVLAAVVVSGLLKAEALSGLLDRYANRVLGPVLVLAGMLVLELITVPLPAVVPGGWLRGRIEQGRALWALPLGALLALGFCPPSAGMFFGSLVPLAARHESPLLLPLVYGAATGLPVAVLGVMMALGVRWLGAALGRLQAFAVWARRVTGALLILVGIYYCLVYIFRVPLY